jgi:unsaturated chondroitin disaccharide hydrolase
MPADALATILDRVAAVSAEVGPRFPLHVEPDGNWNTTADGNWCAGYWIGLQFLAAKHTGAERLGSSARAGIERMLGQPTRNIFAGVNHHVAGFWAADVTGDESLHAIGLRGAEAMRDLYDGDRRQIPIGLVRLAPFDETNPEGAPLHDLLDVAAVDVVHTSLPVLWRATAETGDATFADAALAHALRHLELHCRDDGSTIQMTRLDERGEPVERLNPLADNLDSCWSRGTAWHIAGLADAYVATERREFIEAIERSVAYWNRSARGDVPSWDLDLPDGDRDSSAAAIAAYGLLRLGAARLGDARIAVLAAEGERLLGVLVDRYLVDGALAHGCYQHPQGIAVDTETIWGDFYAAAALELSTR